MEIPPKIVCSKIFGTDFIPNNKWRILVLEKLKWSYYNIIKIKSNNNKNAEITTILTNKT